MIILYLIYDIVFILGFVLYLPVYIFRKKINMASFMQKLGILGRLNLKESIWIQAVSVGEVNLLESLIERLKSVYDYPIVISTTTLTGNRVARKRYSSLAKIIFFPLDVSLILEVVIRKIKPKIFIALETEIWPNLFFRLKKRNIPIVIVNGRISDRAFRRYGYIRSFLKGIFNNCNYVGVQNTAYRDKFLYLGCRKEKIVISGNMKFESISVNEDRLENFKKKYTPLFKKDNSLVIIAASTHHNEEEVFLKIYQDFINAGENLSLLIAPRHTERVPLLEKLATSYGFKSRRISKIDDYKDSQRRVYLLDTMGDLLYFYSISDICFVGGSLVKCGGHNILEPIYFLKPTIFGPHMDNFRDIEETVLVKGAGIKVKDANSLKSTLAGLIKDQALRDNLRQKCLKVFQEERIAYEKNLEIILKCFQ